MYTLKNWNTLKKLKNPVNMFQEQLNWLFLKAGLQEKKATKDNFKGLSDNYHVTLWHILEIKDIYWYKVNNGTVCFTVLYKRHFTVNM